MTNPDLIALANELDDIETDAGGKCNWSEVATVSSALRRLASSDSGVKGEPVAWQTRVMFDKGSARENEWCPWRDCSEKWYEHTKAEIAAGKNRLEARALHTAPPADAGMRPTTKNILERINTELSTMAESWVGAFSGLSDGDDVAEYLTGTVWANLATAIDALTATGATMKSDVEALAATTAERPGTVTSEPEPSTSDPFSGKVPCCCHDAVSQRLCLDKDRCYTIEAQGGPSDTPPGLQAVEAVPYAWVIPGGDQARDNGFIDAMICEEGEFTKPLYEHPPTRAAVEAVSVDEVERVIVAWADAEEPELTIRQVHALARALLAKFKMEGR